MANDYKVLYRKYRPTSFDEVIGQKYSITMLKNAVINNKISHAYIFTGPRGTGKTSTAKIFAKTINCENPKDGIPCGKCNSCLNINNNADIIEIDAASNNGVDEVRELINNVKVAPSFSKYKVYIIDEVHMLSTSAFNALLLTLEEPPAHIVFILATTNIESVPITILSRCQRYDFKKIEFDELVNHLKCVCEKENIKINDEALEEIAYLSEGGCRDALSILNQLSTSNDSIDLNTVLMNYGSVSFVQIKNIISSFMNNDLTKLEEYFNELKNSSVDYKFFLKKMIDLLFKEAIKMKNSNKNDDFLKIKNTIFELNDVINKINITIDPFLLIFLVFSNHINSSKDNINLKIEKDSVNSEKLESINISIDNNLKEENGIVKDNEENVAIKQEIKKNDKEFEDYLKKLQEVRLNNCFAQADKTLLKEFKEKWIKFDANISSTDTIKPCIMDSSVVLASSSINIIMHMQPSMVELFNNELDKIESKYQEVIGESVHFIALSSEMWEISKKEYVKRLKEHYNYQILEEPVFTKEELPSIIENEETEDNNMVDISEIFDKDKIEVQ